MRSFVPVAFVLLTAATPLQSATVLPDPWPVIGRLNAPDVPDYFITLAKGGAIIAAPDRAAPPSSVPGHFLQAYALCLAALALARRLPRPRRHMA